MADSAQKMWSRFGQVAGKLRTSVTEFAADVLDTAEELSHQVERSQNSGSEQLPASKAAPEQPNANAMRERLALLRSRMAAERSGRGYVVGEFFFDRHCALRADACLQHPVTLLDRSLTAVPHDLARDESDVRRVGAGALQVLPGLDFNQLQPLGPAPTSQQRASWLL